MKKWIGYGASFLGVYLLFVMATIPATFVLGFVEVPKKVSLEGVSGTVWDTKIDKIVHEEVTLTKIEAGLNFWSIFTLDPSVDISFGNSLTKGPEGELTISGFTSVLSVQDANILISANTLVERVSLPIEVIARNDIRIFIDDFVMGKPLCEIANAEIQWKKATIEAMKSTVELGDLLATVSCKKGELEITMDPKNDLGLTLVVDVNHKDMSGNGTLLPGKKFPKALEAVLPFLGQADNKGQYRLKF